MNNENTQKYEQIKVLKSIESSSDNRPSSIVFWNVEFIKNVSNQP